MTQRPKATVEPQDPSKQEPGTPTPSEPAIIDPRASLELAEQSGLPVPGAGKTMKSGKQIASLGEKYPNASPQWIWARLKERPRQVLDLLARDATLSAQAAARKVGMKNGARIAREYSKVLDWRRDELAAQSILHLRGWLARLVEIQEKAPKDADKLKALELVAKVQGWLSEKLTVTIEPAQVRRELGGTRAALRQLAESGENTGSNQPIDATVVSPKLEALEGTGNRPLPMASSPAEDPSGKPQ